MPHPGAEGSLELLLRKLLLGEELVNTEFHLFSMKSSSGRIVKPRVLCANNDLLAKNSKYFTDLLGSDIDPSDPSLRELTDGNDVPSECRIDDYGYGSDSDLEDPISETLVAQLKTFVSPKNGAKTNSNHNTSGADLSDDESDSDASDTFFMSSERSSTDDQLLVRKDATNETVVEETPNSDALDIPSVLRSSRSRHVLVKDTAFQTWYTLLNYLSTDKVAFLPLHSAMSSGGLHRASSSTDSLDKPRCSAKSMYRLACKVGLDDLRNEALTCIRSNLTEHNILKEISCSLVASHRQLLEMELDVLFSHVASPPVVAGFPAFVQRIVNKELPHGAEILLDIHGRFLKVLHPLPSISAPPRPSLAFPRHAFPDFTPAIFPSDSPAAAATTTADPPSLATTPFEPPHPHPDTYPVEPPTLEPTSLGSHPENPPSFGWGDWITPAPQAVSEEIPCDGEEDSGFAGPKKKSLRGMKKKAGKKMN